MTKRGYILNQNGNGNEFLYVTLDELNKKSIIQI